MPFELPPLPYEVDALEPHMSAETLKYHHGGHHRAYMDKLNELIRGTGLDARSLETIILRTADDDRKTQKKIFNNAAQAWNHTFFWDCMSPKGGGSPARPFARQMDKAFGDLDAFKGLFKKAATGQFGSGYAWLVLDDGMLKVRSSANATPPMVDGQTALLGCDVWEHAYYLDYRNRRADFVDAFLNELVNWEVVAMRLEFQLAQRPGRLAMR